MVLDRDYIQIRRRRRVRVTYLRHFVPSLLLQEIPARAQLALTRLQCRNRVRPFLPLRTPFALQFALGTLQRFPPRSPSLLAFLLFPLFPGETCGYWRNPVKKVFTKLSLSQTLKSSFSFKSAAFCCSSSSTALRSSLEFKRLSLEHEACRSETLQLKSDNLDRLTTVDCKLPLPEPPSFRSFAASAGSLYRNMLFLPRRMMQPCDNLVGLSTWAVLIQQCGESGCNVATPLSNSTTQCSGSTSTPVNTISCLYNKRF